MNITFKLGFIVTLLFMLSACAEGPNSSVTLAEQGLLSGELSVDGNFAAVGSIHHGGSYWDLKRKERLYNWNHQSGQMSSLRATAISKDGKRAVTCEEDALVLWDTQTGEYKQFWKAEDRILTIALNKKGTKALMGLRNGTVSFFDLERGNAIHNFKHQAEVRKVVLSGDGKIGMSAGDDNKVVIYDLKTGKEIQSKTLKNQIKTIAISTSGTKAFATAQREDAIVWEVGSEKILYSKHNRVVNYTSASFSENERHLSLGTFAGQVIRLDIQSGQELNSWQAAPRQAYGSAASKAIISITDNNQVVSVLTSDGMFQTFK